MIQETIQTQAQRKPTKPANPITITFAQAIRVLLVGMAFGIILTKSEVISWYRIQKMFTFQEAHMYLVITSAVVTGALSLLILKRLGLRTVQGEAIQLKEKPFQKGMIFGGILFGLGWAITGACPGPIYAQIGSGESLALLTFVGAFIGAYLYAYVRAYLPH
ncbi:MAG: YeeE/YedE family protein [Caldilineaceae bacterium]|nr:YeeE/YedE family protein [Caldilineaceae bacterium]